MEIIADKKDKESKEFCPKKNPGKKLVEANCIYNNEVTE